MAARIRNRFLVPQGPAVFKAPTGVPAAVNLESLGVQHTASLPVAERGGCARSRRTDVLRDRARPPSCPSEEEGYEPDFGDATLSSVTFESSDVLRFYDEHPISEDRVLAALWRSREDPPRPTPDELFPHDQDHYGGLAAVEALARRAAIGRRSQVLDVCAGLAGPARFLAHRFGCHVTALDLNHGRSAGAHRLTRLVGLSRLVVSVRGDAQTLPFRDAVFTAVVSQEGLLHVPDKAAVLRESHRVLMPGARIAFSDWTATPRLEDGERRRLARWMAAVDIQSPQGYRQHLARAGFTGIEAEDLSQEWVGILRERRRMYVRMRADTVARLGEARCEEYNQLYAFFVRLVEAGKLGGGRFSATAGR
jgi:sarcosine/dimethylglycine N-methyltransferase